jgi:hypothetical protein
VRLRRSGSSASFQIDTTQNTEQAGLHMSVSPDNGSGARMSYLRFEDQVDGVHVFFDDVTDSGPYYTLATFNETDIATLSRTQAHTIGFSMHFVSGPGNDVVRISVDGSLVKTGTTWENYYRFDNEGQAGLDPPPTTTTMLFRESGAANTANGGKGFLVDNLSYTSATVPTCTTTGFFRDGINPDRRADGWLRHRRTRRVRLQTLASTTRPASSAPISPAPTATASSTTASRRTSPTARSTTSVRCPSTAHSTATPSSTSTAHHHPDQHGVALPEERHHRQRQGRQRL